jgi:outer membrane protein TolC
MNRRLNQQSEVIVAVLVTLLSTVGAPLAAESEPLDVHAIVALALERNPALKSVEERQNEFDGGIREAKADAFPQLALRSSFSQNRNPSLLNSPDFEDFLEFIPDFKPSIAELYNVSVEVSQPLYTAGKVGSAIELARLASNVSRAQIEVARLDTASAAAEAYFRLLEAREGLVTIEIQQQTRRESLAVVQARYDLGDATELERLQSEAALAELQPIVDAARGLVRVAEINLRAVLDLRDGSEVTVAEVSDTLPDLPPSERAMELALAHRPEFDNLELQIAALEKQTQITQADGLPQIDLTGVYGHSVRLFDDIDDSRFKDWAFALAMRWEFFDGGRRKGRVSQLESQRQQLQWQLAALNNQVRQEVEAALTEYATALSRWRATEISARAAREASRVAVESYQEGVAIQADWLNAQEREIQAEVGLVQAYYGARISAARLARAVGLLADEAWGPGRESKGNES